MKKLSTISFLLLPVLAFCQYPANPNKMRLGVQTTGQGLVFVGDSIPNWTPNAIANAWMSLDTVNNLLYCWNPLIPGWEVCNEPDIDTVYIVPTVPDTSSLTPQQGDVFINAARDTLGVYDGNMWVLFFGLTDHVALTGLADDDHTQYALLAGRATGQTLTGGTASGDDLTLRSTTNATKGTVIVQDQGGDVAIGDTQAYGKKLYVGNVLNNPGIVGGGVYSYLELTGTAPTPAFNYAGIFEAFSNSGNKNQVAAIYANAYHYAGTGLDTLTGIDSYTYFGNNGGPTADMVRGISIGADSDRGTTTNQIGIDLWQNSSSSSLVTNMYGLKMLLRNDANDVVNKYGIYLENTGTVSGVNYGIYQVSTGATNQLFGNTLIGGGASAAELRFLEPSGSGTNYTAFKAQAQSGNVTYTLPAADGSGGQQLTTNGSGGLSWQDAGSVCPTFDTSLVSAATLNIDLTGACNRTVKIDMAANAAVTLTFANPGAVGSQYNFQITNVDAGGSTVTWPGTFLDMDGTALGSVLYPTGQRVWCYFDGTNYNCQ